jgi:3-dehydrosphinganine reductase
LISEGSGIWDPDVVGKKIVKEACKSNPSFDIYFGIDGWMLSTLACGFNPVTSVLDAVCQVSMMGLLRFVSLFYLMDFGRITQNCIDSSENASDKPKED